MKSPFFSIIIPAYNAQDTIASTIKSLLDQKYEKYEIIVVDDGSTDSTLDRIKAIASPRIKCYRKANGGVSSARNFGLKKAAGEWIIFLDSDDTLTKDSLQKLSDIISRNDVDYIITPIKTIKPIAEKNMRIPQGKMDFIAKTDTIDGLIFNLSSSPLYIPRGIGGKIIRREIIETNEISFDERLKIFEDGIFNIAVSANTDKIIFYNETIYEYDRSNQDSRSNTFYPEVTRDNEIIFETIKKLLKKIDYSSPAFPYLCLELLHNSSLATSRKPINTKQKIAKLKQLRTIYIENYIGKIKLSEAYKTLKIVYTLSRARTYRLLLLFYKQLFKSLQHRNRV